MKKLFFALALVTFLFVAQSQAQCKASAPATDVGLALDLAKPFVNVNGTKYRYVFGAKITEHLNPAGKVSIIRADGYLMKVGSGETVFVITRVRVTALQG
jgi:hypothetical protein